MSKKDKCSQIVPKDGVILREDKGNRKKEWIKNCKDENKFHEEGTLRMKQPVTGRQRGGSYQPALGLASGILCILRPPPLPFRTQYCPFGQIPAWHPHWDCSPPADVSLVLPDTSRGTSLLRLPPHSGNPVSSLEHLDRGIHLPRSSSCSQCTQMVLSSYGKT